MKIVPNLARQGDGGARVMPLRIAAVCLLLVAVRTTAIPASVLPAPIKQSLAPYVPTPEDVVERMLRLAQTTRDDVVFDLGSGDGRIPIAAAKLFGARAVSASRSIRGA